MKLKAMVLAMVLSMAPVWAAACDGMGGAKGAAHSTEAAAHSAQVAQQSDGAQCPHMKEGAAKHQCNHAKSEAGMAEGKGCCCKGKDGAMADGKACPRSKDGKMASGEGCCKGGCARAKAASEKKI